MKLEIWCGGAHPYKTIAKFILHSILKRTLMGRDPRQTAGEGRKKGRVGKRAG